MRDSWLRFWDRPHAIYANDRHRQVHYVRIADDILSILPSRAGLRILDFGCGEAREAARVAARTERLFLYDAAPSVRARLFETFRDTPKLTVLDDEGLAGVPRHSIDVVTVSSVIQYIDRDLLPAILLDLRRLLADDGMLVIADVIPPEAGLVADVTALLSTGARHGFLLAAIGSLGATLFSDYRRIRRQIGLSAYGDSEFVGLLASAGFAATRLDRNFGFNPRRRTYVARPRLPSIGAAAQIPEKGDHHSASADQGRP
ncbi:methyltransferase domain-containing protein [Thalassobaculum sp.]|uniref:methyltransferase domain-containing protein n=1 Tax=Thalassobaculum sp. TaxID=2022740 RepID=UPI0032EB6EA4